MCDSLETIKRASTALDAAHQALQRANTLFRLIDLAIVEGKLEIADASNLAEIGRELTASLVSRLDQEIEYFTGVSRDL